MNGLGLYHLPDLAKTQAIDDPRVNRLRTAWKAWECRSHPAGGTLLLPKDSTATLADCGPAQVCTDGLRWHPPKDLPTLHDLAREDIPQPSSTVELRRHGVVSLPLGVGPIFATGRRRGKPSSSFGALITDLYARSMDRDRPWTDADERDVEVALFLALQSCYHLTAELFEEMSPFDADEMRPMMGAIWGTDPKASATGGRTSPPSLPDSSAVPA